MYKESLPDGAFYNNGRDKGPTLFMTYNCPEERDALHLVWPESELVLCTFHMLQQVWRWLHDKNHCIDKLDRPILLSKFKRILYSETIDLFEEEYMNFLNDPIFDEKYNKFLNYIKNLYSYKESWALFFRKNTLTRGNNTNNNAEAQFLVIKDIILQRVKEYNVNALFEKLTEDLNDHYQNKLLSVASGSYDGFYSPRFIGKSKKKGEIGFVKPDALQLSKMEAGLIDYGNNVFSVPSATTEATYIVDLNISRCDCQVGQNGSNCKHQYVLWALQKGTGHNFLPVFEKEKRKKFALIAIGEALPDDYYEGLHGELTQFNEATPDDEIAIDLVKTVSECSAKENEESKDTFSINVEDQKTQAEDALQQTMDIFQKKLKVGIQRF